MNKTIFIFAGEQSGDTIGGHLVQLLKSQSYNCIGVGGSKMAQQGMEMIMSIDQFQIMGFFQVVKNLPKIIGQFYHLKKIIFERNPDFVLFIDYPGFSLKMAKALKRSKFKGKIIQYVCPSIWAWKKGRKKILERYFDLLFTLFPFEKALFNNSPLKAVWCGHLLANQEIKPIRKKYLMLFPGSRMSVIEQNLPLQLKAAKLIQKDLDLPIAISCARADLLGLIQKLNHDNFQIFNDGSEKEQALAAIATCGTITLELALLQIPTVVTYQLKKIDAWIARTIFKLNLPFYCIVNILLNREVLPEFVQTVIDPNSIAQSLKKCLNLNFPHEDLKKQVYNKEHDLIFIKAIKSLTSPI